MRTQTPRTRSVADALARHTRVLARMLLVGMLLSVATAQAARTTAKAKAAEATQATERRAAPAPTTVYRCRQADGQMLYTQHACPPAAADKVMQISDARTAEQARHSEGMHSRNRKLGQRMQRERQTWARQASRQNKQALALTLPELEEAEASKEKTGKRKSTSRSSKQASRKTRPDKHDARDPKPLRPADFVARVPGTKASTAKQRQSKEASADASPQS